MDKKPYPHAATGKDKKDAKTHMMGDKRMAGKTHPAGKPKPKGKC